MRILACNEHYSIVGGAEVYFLDAISRLEQMGHEVGVLHDTAPGNDSGPRPAFRVPGGLGFDHTGKGALPAIREALRQFRPDVIFIAQVLNPAAIGLLSESAPAVRYVLGLRLSCPSGRRMPRTWDGICTKPFDAHCLWKAHTQLCMPRRPDTALRVWRDVRKNQQASGRLHRLLLPSRYVRELLIESGMNPEQLEVLHLYTRLSAEIEAAGPAPERRILLLGRPSPEKGFDLVLQALAHIEAPTTLEIAGDGPFIADLRRMAGEIPSRHEIVFSGFIPRDRISEAYRRARVAVVPSIWPEPFGIVGIEAMAHGLPAVAFDVGGIPDWLTDGLTGALVPRKDVPGLARALESYLSDPELAQKHGQAGRDMVRRRFLPEHHMNRLVEVFEEATSS
ncbi:MAG: glycosyltransferase family 4 protein [bacterium]|nr:glycosyltransferase family 4 protein [bacterium]